MLIEQVIPQWNRLSRMVRTKFYCLDGKKVPVSYGGWRFSGPTVRLFKPPKWASKLPGPLWDWLRLCYPDCPFALVAADWCQEHQADPLYLCATRAALLHLHDVVFALYKSPRYYNLWKWHPLFLREVGEKQLPVTVQEFLGWRPTYDTPAYHQYMAGGGDRADPKVIKHRRRVLRSFVKETVRRLWTEPRESRPIPDVLRCSIVDRRFASLLSDLRIILPIKD